jgi:hypothetical protein
VVKVCVRAADEVTARTPAAHDHRDGRVTDGRSAPRPKRTDARWSRKWKPTDPGEHRLAQLPEQPIRSSQRQPAPAPTRPVRPQRQAGNTIKSTVPGPESFGAPNAFRMQPLPNANGEGSSQRVAGVFAARRVFWWWGLGGVAGSEADRLHVAAGSIGERADVACDVAGLLLGG